MLTDSTQPAGHNPGTAAPDAVEARAPATRAVDRVSTALPGWPRLMPLEMAAEYVGLSPDTLLGYVADGTLRVTRPLRPQTLRALGHRHGKSRRTVVHVETLRRRLFDRVDLDELVNRWKREGAA